MWRSKKLIVGVVLAAVMLVGSIGGTALAQTGNGNDSQHETRYDALLDRVCEIYEHKTGVAIDQEALRDSFAQAQDEMRAEAMQNRLQSLVEQGVITQEQANELQKWWEARPDVPVKFGFRGMGGMRGFGRPCAPQNN